MFVIISVSPNCRFIQELLKMLSTIRVRKAYGTEFFKIIFFANTELFMEIVKRHWFAKP